MNVTIIGTGNMAKGIGTRLISGGHALTLHAQDQGKGRALADELAQTLKHATAEVTGAGGPTDSVVILAVPHDAIPSIAHDYNGLAGKVVVDITNPVDFQTLQLTTPPGTAGAEEVARLLPEAKVVKAFNTTLAGTLLTGEVDGRPLDVFVAADDQAAKDQVMGLVKDGGLRPIDAGPLANARHLEGMQLIQMMNQDRLGTNWMSALKILP